MVLTEAKSNIKIVADDDAADPSEPAWYKGQNVGTQQLPTVGTRAQGSGTTNPPGNIVSPPQSPGPQYNSFGTGMLILFFCATMLFGLAGIMRIEQNNTTKNSTPPKLEQPISEPPRVSANSLRVVTELKPLSMNLPNPNESEVRGMSDFELGIAEYEQKRYSSAITAFQRARAANWQIDFDRSICDYQAARCNYKLGNLAEAVALFSKVQMQADRYRFTIPSLALDLGYTYLKEKDYRNAAQTFESDCEFRLANDLDIHGPTVGLHQTALEQLDNDEVGAIKTYIQFLNKLRKPEELQHWYTGSSSIETMIRRDASRSQDPKIRETLENRANLVIKEFL
jgi:tetratricopeptide (TPR) repeat protein